MLGFKFIQVALRSIIPASMEDPSSFLLQGSGSARNSRFKNCGECVLAELERGWR